MDLTEDVFALLLMWLVFMTVVGIYVVRIGWLLREQWYLERGYRLRLAARRRRMGRESAPDDPQRPAV